MIRLKEESILNEPEFWLALLRIPPQALGRPRRTPVDACGQCGIASRRIDRSSGGSQITRQADDSGFKCKV